MNATTTPAGASLRLERRYGEVRAVDGVSLDVAAGEFFISMAPASPTCPRSVAASGVVFQSYALFPHMTVFENIAFPLRIRRTPKREIARRVEEAWEVVAGGPPAMPGSRATSQGDVR